MDLTAFSSQADKLNSALSSSSSSLPQLANYALQRGLTALQNNKPDQAINAFRMAVGVDPTNTTAWNYLGNTYLQKNDTKNAISAFKMATSIDPTDPNGFNNLGNAYLQAKDNKNAEAQFKLSIKASPNSSTPYYTLGLLYAKEGRNTEAEQQFAVVQRLSPQDANGYYGMGMAYNNEGKYDEAITQLNKATRLKKNFDNAVYELGKAYAGKGDMDSANDQISTLKAMPASTNGAELAAELKDTITKPEMSGVDMSKSTFTPIFTNQTPLFMLDISLLQPNTSKDFTMTFQFNSNMDPSSAQNISNWSITKGSSLPGGLYDNGVIIGQDTPVSPVPKSVAYDATTNEATVTFTLSQNSSGNATIDPSHLVFKFAGKDVNGKQMDSSSDEYAGFKGGMF
jgi:Flp pilus assembly protein TadD